MLLEMYPIIIDLVVSRLCARSVKGGIGHTTNTCDIITIKKNRQGTMKYEYYLLSLKKNTTTRTNKIPCPAMNAKRTSTSLIR